MRNAKDQLPREESFLPRCWKAEPCVWLLKFRAISVSVNWDKRVRESNLGLSSRLFNLHQNFLMVST